MELVLLLDGKRSCNMHLTLEKLRTHVTEENGSTVSNIHASQEKPNYKNAPMHQTKYY